MYEYDVQRVHSTKLHVLRYREGENTYRLLLAATHTQLFVVRAERIKYHPWLLATFRFVSRDICIAKAWWWLLLLLLPLLLLLFQTNSVFGLVEGSWLLACAFWLQLFYASGVRYTHTHTQSHRCVAIYFRFIPKTQAIANIDLIK